MTGFIPYNSPREDAENHFKFIWSPLEGTRVYPTLENHIRASYNAVINIIRFSELNSIIVY